MIDLAQKQQEALQDEKRTAIFAFLEGKVEQPLGAISRGIELRDLAKVHHHVDVLVDVDLVEKVRGTNKYRLVEGE